MTIKTTYAKAYSGDAMQAYQSLKALRSIPVQGKMAILRALKYLDSEKELLNEMMEQNKKKYIDIGHARMVKAARSPESGDNLPRPDYPMKDELPAFLKENNELAASAVTFNLDKIALSTIGGAEGLAVGDLLTLDWLLEDDLGRPKPALAGGLNRENRRADRKLKGSKA